MIGLGQRIVTRNKLRHQSIELEHDAQTSWVALRGFTLTRMYYRYGKNGLDQDLVFKARGIVGGRGMPNFQGEFERA